MISQPSQPGTPTIYAQESTPPVVDSTAFFIRADKTGKEILIFGDVEPDSISLLPRTHFVWSEAATKIVNGLLTGVFIECSYNDSQDDKVLFGHLAPRHLIQELQNLADLVVEKRREAAEKVGHKRKRASTAFTITDENRRGSRTRTESHLGDEPMNDTPDDNSQLSASSTFPQLNSNRLRKESDPHKQSLPSRVSLEPFSQEPPLKDIKVIIIHVKDSMADGQLVGESILEELKEHEARLESQKRGLGCTFSVCNPGESYIF